MRITDTEEEGVEKREIKHSGKYYETLTVKMRVHQ